MQIMVLYLTHLFCESKQVCKTSESLILGLMD